MIELSTYLWTVGSLITIIILFLAHYLREPRIKSAMSALKRQNSELRDKDSESQANILNLEKKINKQQEQITEQERNLSIPAKFVFNPHMGTVKIGDEHYCTKCVLEFKEAKLDPLGNDFKCPECGTDYRLGKISPSFPNH